MIITTAYFHSTRPELRFSAGSNFAFNVLEIPNGENLQQYPRPEIRFNVLTSVHHSSKLFIINLLSSTKKWCIFSFVYIRVTSEDSVRRSSFYKILITMLFEYRNGEVSFYIKIALKFSRHSYEIPMDVINDPLCVKAVKSLYQLYKGSLISLSC